MNTDKLSKYQEQPCIEKFKLFCYYLRAPFPPSEVQQTNDDFLSAIINRNQRRREQLHSTCIQLDSVHSTQSVAQRPASFSVRTGYHQVIMTSHYTLLGAQQGIVSAQQMGDKVVKKLILAQGKLCSQNNSCCHTSAG